MQLERERSTASLSPGPSFTRGHDSSGVVAGSPLLDICNAMVGVYKEAIGRGPTKARARLAGSDVLVVVLEDTMTRSERNLIAMGEDERLHQTRLCLHAGFEAQIRGIVEAILDRPTIAFATGIDLHRDVTVDVFTLGAWEDLRSRGASTRPP
jgi:uncharacterized protein YbcI